MNATDELRRMLDELGVEWEADDEMMDDGTLSQVTYWFSNGVHWSADGRDEYLAFDAVQLITPAQAIAATLGVGTCKLEEIEKDCDTASEYMLNREWCFDAVYKCSCGCRFGYVAHDRPHHCPNCGRRCVG